MSPPRRLTAQQAKNVFVRHTVYHEPQGYLARVFEVSQPTISRAIASERQRRSLTVKP